MGDDHEVEMSRVPQVAMPVTEVSQVGEARRRAMGWARSLGFSETDTGKVGIVVSEVAGNLVKHATDGEVLLRALKAQGVPGMEILALDRGPGISHVADALRDGHSSTHTPGTGLGAIVRLSALFDLYSVVGVGTALLAHVWSRPWPKRAGSGALELGAVCLPLSGQEATGDGWAVAQRPGRSLMMVVDGLGHGPNAADVPVEATKVFEQQAHFGPGAMIEAAHAALRRTRGAAMAVAEVDAFRGMVRYAGVGNISGVILFPGGSHRMVSHNGVVGHELHKIQEFTYAWPVEGTDSLPLLVMHSDGLGSRWSLEEYPGLSSRSPGVIAGVLYRDFSRGHDDVTVLVGRAIPCEGGMEVRG